MPSGNNYSGGNYSLTWPSYLPTLLSSEGFGSNDNSYPFECNSPLSSSELAVSPPDTILVSHQLKPNLTSLCDTMSSDPASAAVISAAWEETMARLIITEQPEGVGTSYCAIFVAIVILLQCLTILMSSCRGILIYVVCFFPCSITVHATSAKVDVVL